ncbi:MAG: hypothetical protein KKI06_00315 [Euryarchaeota archaeon]|nr:hypothetical protein [Euryarchaeota archaeon]MBU4221519.1 hypothetical protein [Euryarchaeota archaeon]MCG2734845.1 hypothetical protein [Candidatus Methanoperedenaceae archaeon]
MRKPVIIIIILLLVLAISVIFVISMQRNTAVIVVEVTLAQPPDNNIEHIISNVNASLSYVTNMDMPKETPLISPGITVVLIQDMKVRSGWYSVGIPASGIYGNYTIKVKPYDDFNISRPFVVLTRVMDPTEKEVSVKRTEYKIS